MSKDPPRLFYANSILNAAVPDPYMLKTRSRRLNPMNSSVPELKTGNKLVASYDELPQRPQNEIF